MARVTETVETRHGEVEYEAAECDNCGSEYLPEEMVEAEVGGRELELCGYCAGENAVPREEQRDWFEPLFITVLALVCWWFAPVILAGEFYEAALDPTDSDDYLVAVFCAAFGVVVGAAAVHLL